MARNVNIFELINVFYWESISFGFDLFSTCVSCVFFSLDCLLYFLIYLNKCVDTLTWYQCSCFPFAMVHHTHVETLMHVHPETIAVYCWYIHMVQKQKQKKKKKKSKKDKKKNKFKWMASMIMINTLFIIWYNYNLTWNFCVLFLSSIWINLYKCLERSIYIYNGIWDNNSNKLM